MTTGPAPAFGAFTIDELDDTVTAAAVIDPGLIDSIRDAETRHALLDSLVQHRVAGGLSRREVARRIGCSPATVARFESEDSDPLLSLLQRYARAVGTQLQISLPDPAAPRTEAVPDRLPRRLLDRLKSVSPEQLADALQEAGPPFTFVRAMPDGRVQIITDRVTANSEPVTIYASTAVTGDWHVDDGGETYHRLADAGFDINQPGNLDIFHNALYRYRLHRVGGTVFARAPEDEPIQFLCRRFADALVALDALRVLAEPPAPSPG